MASIIDLIGNTPIIKLQKIIPPNSGSVYVKLEDFNLGNSIKSRIALQMIIDAEKQGLLKPNSGQTLIEPTGGNTGIGLAILGILRGYNVILVMPDNYSEEKVNILRAYGAKVILSDSKQGNDSHIKKVSELCKEYPEYVWLNQFSNPSNPKAHYLHTGQEIIDQFEQIDCFVAGIGSGGTITGIGKKIKEKFPGVRIVGVQPKGCDVMNGFAIPNKIEGLAVGMVPQVFDRSVITNVIEVTEEQAIECMNKVAKKEGILVGVSSGANIYGAIEIAKQMGPEKTIVTIAPDSGRNYIKYLL